MNPDGLGKDSSIVLDELLEKYLPELRQHARSLLRGERPGHTLQPTALLNEALCRIIAQVDGCSAPDADTLRGAVVARMRKVLIDHARRRARRIIGRHLEEECCPASRSQSPATLAAIREQCAGFVATMSDLELSVWGLKHGKGLSAAVVADTLGIGESRVEHIVGDLRRRRRMCFGVAP